VAIARKVAHPISVRDARSFVADRATWRIIDPSCESVLRAIDTASRWKISFRDAMVVRAAVRAGVSVLWFEDLNHGQSYDGVVVRNPFST
jgi:predicted nucleic acid-binding protein